jgi:exopolyphosphatase/guanosine-5'-triphosphate,3'-diphosphate pyrophosphatase
MPGVLPRLRWQKGPDGSLLLVLPADLASLQGERPKGRLEQLARLMGRKLEMQICGE